MPKFNYGERLSQRELYGLMGQKRIFKLHNGSRKPQSRVEPTPSVAAFITSFLFALRKSLIQMIRLRHNIESGYTYL